VNAPSEKVGVVTNTLGTKRHEMLVGLLREKREAAGLTQSELASKLGVYQSFVARLESGQRRVDVVEFLDLARILEFDPLRVLQVLNDA
jgi:transcriptional regulator with XRE-family HTH domain